MHAGCVPLLAWQDAVASLGRDPDLGVKGTLPDILKLAAILKPQAVGRVPHIARRDVGRSGPPMKRPVARLAHAGFTSPSFSRECTTSVGPHWEKSQRAERCLRRTGGETRGVAWLPSHGELTDRGGCGAASLA